MARKIYSWGLDYEEKAIEKSDVVFKHLFASVYETVKDNRHNGLGYVRIDKDIAEFF